MKPTRIAILSTAFLAVAGEGLWSLAQETSADVDAVFQRLDKNGDGKLSADEIPKDQGRYFERLLRRAKKDANSELTREEFRQASRPEERPNVPLDAPDREQARADARERFEMLDRNKDGKVTLDEVPDQFRERLKPIFERSGKQELTVEDFTRLSANRPDPAEIFKRFDTNGDGKLSRDELPVEIRDRLAPLYDRLGKNELTLEEFIQTRDRMREAGGLRPERQAMGTPEDVFGRLDANSDGKLTLNEAPGRAQPMVEQVLRLAGKDRDDSLTEAEFVKHFPSLAVRTGTADQNARGERRPDSERTDSGRQGDAPAESERSGVRNAVAPSEARSPAIFRLLDANRDGHVSKEEFAKIAEIFDQLDRNRDGQLDPMELMGMPTAEGRDPRRAESARDGNAASRERSEGRQDANGNVGAFFQRLDGNADGKISRDELPTFLKDKFPMLDINGDGFVTQDELRAGAKLLGDGSRNRRSETSKPE